MIPEQPKIYHIIHYDRLASIVSDGYLWSDIDARLRNRIGTIIGDNDIKQARLSKCLLTYPDLRIGGCVPFYFCPRSVMLYRLMKSNLEGQSYRGGEVPIVHLEADLRLTVLWAREYNKRWVFTTENARANSAEDYSDIRDLDKLDWNAIRNDGWGYNGIDPAVKSHKQSEFLLEEAFPWHLVERIGVHPKLNTQCVFAALASSDHRPQVEFRKDWYYNG